MREWLSGLGLLGAFLLIAVSVIWAAWDWIKCLPDTSATFLGAMIGAGLGLVAIVLGALFNAWLNRRRDDRLRGQEQRAILIALRTELEMFGESCRDVAEKLANQRRLSVQNMASLGHSFGMFEAAGVKVGLVELPLIKNIAEAYAHALKLRRIFETIKALPPEYIEDPVQSQALPFLESAMQSIGRAVNEIDAFLDPTKILRPPS